ncbi:hypothetical protein ELQ35_12300 [Peribacillus cavernae]|uniref:Uncharacterized protein n=1 Tax=Peribacillus cavernae TaxID=1674310 RepID=A0A3S0W5S8_9BACI|nr:hypothetical protein [Peribacillus cavernae]MDQ0218361.1 hypothetical protein [Peribacillus cavernae]RUQ28364.1 hypothetical protein ELQ35_12300 [Peribacillus cavernae]
MKKREEQFLTNASKEKQFTIESDTFPNLKNIPGDSVDEYTDLKTANIILAGEEIGQQNENL